MKLIVGLGNPGMRYAGTRHNVGFDTVDLLARRFGWSWTGKRSRALLAEGIHNGEKIILAKPQTYMNESGLAVGELVRFYKLDLASLLVVCDDLDLPLGKVRARARGASGGQHGLESIIQHLGGATGFPRVKIGIGRPAQGRDQNIDFLLSRPTLDDRIELDRASERAADAILSALDEGIEAAMNRFNSSGTRANLSPNPKPPVGDPTPPRGGEPRTGPRREVAKGNGGGEPGEFTTEITEGRRGDTEGGPQAARPRGRAVRSGVPGARVTGAASDKPTGTDPAGSA